MLDVKLAFRMLMKYRGLSLVSVMGMSVAIAIGAMTFAGVGTLMDPELPLDDGERLVSIRNWNVTTNEADERVVHDFLLWKAELTSLRDLGAFRGQSRTLMTSGTPHPVQVAEMTASGFRVARVTPIRGRPLLEDDEREGATPVVVIAQEEWQNRFAGDPNIIGRPVTLGSTVHVVVGVMPAGFRFPVQHRYWVPLRLNATRYARGAGPSISVFGRLADGVTRDRAQLELTTIGLRVAAAFPETNRNIRPRITPYTYPFLGLDNPSLAIALRGMQLVVTLLLILIAVNVAVLVFARTATRMGEIAVRSALGASRRRVVTQLFLEALALSVLAAGVGVAIAGLGLETLQRILQPPQGEEAPFWLHFGLSLKLVISAAGLAVLCAVIVGVLPALKATGRQVHTGLQQLSTRGSQVQLGRTWTVMIISQVAVAVAILPLALYQAGQSLGRASAQPRYAAEEFLQAYLRMARDDAQSDSGATVAAEARFRDRASELVRRLEAEPAVAGVTFDSHLQGYPYAQIEGEGGEARWVYINRVETGHFSLFDIPILAGRGFTESEAREGANSVIVNRILAERLFATVNVLGRRIRYASAGSGKGPWLEIIGVVPDFRVQGDLEPPHAQLYEPMGLTRISPGVKLSIRVRGTAAMDFAERLRRIAAATDESLQLDRLITAADAERQTRRFLGIIATVIVSVVLSVVLLSAAGIYAMMSFTVARRRREIGIRSALGADARRLLAGTFRKASAQLATGVVVGLVLAAFLQGPVEGKGLLLLPLVAMLMMVVGLLAALGPARSGLAIQPIEALREE